MFNKVFAAPVVIILLHTACVPGNQKQSVKFQQYYAEGEVLYQQHCANCHQVDGTGLGKLYPPLASSDFINRNQNDVICLIKNGIKGEVLVNGVSYNQEMKGIPSLTDLEIAEITTYIYNSWGNTHDLVEVGAIAPALLKCQPIP